jgi:hypothetical protein
MSGLIKSFLLWEMNKEEDPILISSAADRSVKDYDAMNTIDFPKLDPQQTLIGTKLKVFSSIEWRDVNSEMLLCLLPN